MLDRIRLKQTFPKASAAFIDLNSELPRANTQLSLCHESLAKKKGTGQSPARCLVRITSYRCGQLADADGLCGKYLVDALRYASAIRDDRTQDIVYQIHQKRVTKKTEEKTLIELIPCT